MDIDFLKELLKEYLTPEYSTEEVEQQVETCTFESLEDSKFKITYDNGVSEIVQLMDGCVQRKWFLGIE